MLSCCSSVLGRTFVVVGFCTRVGIATDRLPPVVQNHGYFVSLECCVCFFHERNKKRNRFVRLLDSHP